MVQVLIYQLVAAESVKPEILDWQAYYRPPRTACLDYQILHWTSERSNLQKNPNCLPADYIEIIVINFPLLIMQISTAVSLTLQK